MRENKIERRPVSLALSGHNTVLRRSFDLYRRNFWPLTFFGGLFWIVLFVGPSLPNLEQEHYRVPYSIVAVISILASIQVSYICVIWGSFQALLDRRISIASALRQVSLRNVLRFVWTAGLSMVLVLIGVLALVIPGLVVGVRLSMVAPVVVIEGKGGWQALVRSWHLVKGRSLGVFRSLLVVSLPTMLVNAANQLLGHLGLVLEPLAATVITIVVLACSVLAGTFSEVGLTVLYSDLVGSLSHTPSDLARNARSG
ncbi:MAG: hypothetical protein HYY12_06475 [Candidatus Methylomirabilis oxyfera]|nr:hypothetical protein [Candidatus Methylomirabilis oxyfera]